MAEPAKTFIFEDIPEGAATVQEPAPTGDVIFEDVPSQPNTSPIPLGPDPQELREKTREGSDVQYPPWWDAAQNIDRPEIPRVVLDAAGAGVVFDKPAPAGHFLSSLAYDDDERMNAYSISLKEVYGDDAQVRLGDKTGVLEFFDPETERWSLAMPPGAVIPKIQEMGGLGIVVAPEMVLGGLGAAYGGGPVSAYGAAAVGAFTGEIIRLELGKSFGINQKMTTEQELMSAMTEAGISVAGGKASELALKWGKFVIDSINGVPLSKDLLRDLELDVTAASAIADRINTVIGAERFRFNLAQATGDEELLLRQEFFKKHPDWQAEFGIYTDEQNAALAEFWKKLNEPYRSRLSTPEAGRAVQDVAGGVVEGKAQRLDYWVGVKEAELKESMRSIRTRPFESIGEPLRSFASREMDDFVKSSEEAAMYLNRAAGNKPFIQNRNLATVASKLNKQIEESLFPSVDKPGRSLIGPRTFGEDAEGQEILNKIFDPDAKFTFAQAWRAISALKRVARDARTGKATETPEYGAVVQLYKALEKDLRISAQDSPLAPLYDEFITEYSKQKTRLDEGVVREMMRREGSSGSFKVGEEKVFEQFFTPGTKKNSEQLMNLIEDSPELIQGVRQTIGDFYKRRVFRNGRVNLDAHKEFMEQYPEAMSVFFSKEEMQLISKNGRIEAAIQAREGYRKEALKEINKTFEAKIANLNNPGQVLQLILDPKNPDKARQLMGMLEKTPDVRRAVKNEFRKWMQDRVAGQFHNGERFFSAANFDTFLTGKGGEGGYLAVARNLFGEQYANDLHLLNDVLRRVQAEPRFPNRAQTAFWSDMLKNITRAYVGLFTRPGRFLTAADKLRWKAANRLMFHSIMEPENLRELLALRGVDKSDRRVAAFLGSMGATILMDESE